VSVGTIQLFASFTAAEEQTDQRFVIGDRLPVRHGGVDQTQIANGAG
jgi:hypothetical protein